MANKTKRVLITGGAGFIGSALCRYLVSSDAAEVLNLDMLSYAGSTESLKQIKKSALYTHRSVDIRDASGLRNAFQEFQPTTVMHLAAESHVDRSIDGPGEFISTNIVGTYNLLETSTEYWRKLCPQDRNLFRFHHISTDEVFGSLGATGFFTENSPYDPRSPYSASKASSDHLTRAWNHTYGLPTIITNCSNNYGPYQFPEKLIPLVVLNALDRKSIPIYGKGDNVRDWLYVEEHVEALWSCVSNGRAGETYNIGGNEERTNLEVVHTICEELDRTCPHKAGSYKDLIEFVSDRPGHDKRYAIDATKIRNEIGWQPRTDFESGIQKTVQWYLHNRWWWEPIRSRSYSGERLGIAE